MKHIVWAKMFRIALAEGGAIIKSPGFLLAACAPFFLGILGCAALFFISSQDPRVAIVISSDVPQLADDLSARLSQEIGPNANKATLRDSAAANWTVIVADTKINTDISTGEMSASGEDNLPIGALVFLDGAQKTVRIDLNRSPPPYLIDLIRAEASSLFYERASGMELGFEISRPLEVNAPPLSLDRQLIWLLTEVLATAAGALAAASTHALTTAFLDRPSEARLNPQDAQEDFLGKLIGIGVAYATLALPWGLMLSAGLGLIAMTGDPALVEAMQAVAVSAFRLDRFFLFLLCAPAGYALFASIALIMASSAKTAAAARSFTGPLSFFAIAPAPLALAMSSNMEGWLFTALSWFPLTATASIQLGFGALNTYDLFIRALFLVFVALAALQFGMRRQAEKVQI